MSIKYQKVWDTMNDLEMLISKVVSAREMIDIANEAVSVNDQDRAETMTMAAYEFLGYFIEEFDKKFKDAWKATVGDLRDGDVKKDDCMPPWGHSDLEYLVKHAEPLSCDKDDSSSECQGAWNSFWEENYYSEDFEETLKREGYEYAPLPDTSTKVDESSPAVKSYSKYWYEYDRNDSYKKDPFDKVVKWILPIEEIDCDECIINFPDDLLEAADLKEGDIIEWIDQGDGSYLIKKVTKPLGIDEC